jgi:hypothetical protein
MVMMAGTGNASFVALYDGPPRTFSSAETISGYTFILDGRSFADWSADCPEELFRLPAPINWKMLFDQKQEAYVFFYG